MEGWSMKKFKGNKIRSMIAAALLMFGSGCYTSTDSPRDSILTAVNPDAASIMAAISTHLSEFNENFSVTPFEAISGIC